MRRPRRRHRHRAIPKHTHDLFIASFTSADAPKPMSPSPDIPIDVHLGCQASLRAFTAHCEADEFEQMVRYFAPDGLWVRADGALSGLPALQAWATKRRSGSGGLSKNPRRSET
jgi:hypothetical protein